MKSWLSVLILSYCLHFSNSQFLLTEAQTQAEVFRQALTFSKNKQWDEAIKKYQEAFQLGAERC